MLGQRILGGIPDQAARQTNLVHDRVADIDTGAATDAFILLPLADIDAGRAYDHTQPAIDTIAQSSSLGIDTLLARAARLATFGVIGNDQSVRVEHHALEAGVGTHVLADLLAQETRLHVEESGIEKGPEQFPT